MSKLKPPAIDINDVESQSGSTAYPEGFRSICDGRHKKALGDAAGLSQFGVNHVTLEPGAASAQRHWHAKEDEFIFVLSGEITLISDKGEQLLKTGEAAGFPCGEEDGHQLINKSDTPVMYLEVGTRSLNDEVFYPDIDLHLKCIEGNYNFTKKDGTPS